jgi:Replication-relaxation
MCLRGEGSAPFHYTLGPAGAAVLAALRDTTIRALGYDPGDTLALAHSPRLAHILGVNVVLAGLSAAARNRGVSLAEWCPSGSAQPRGAVVRPDACGRWREDGVDGHFFLEYDRGSEPTERVAAKIADYARLSSLTGYTTPVLLWLPGDARESEVRRALAAVRSDAVPVLTGRGDASTLGSTDAVWLPLGIGATRHPAHRPPDVHPKGARPPVRVTPRLAGTHIATGQDHTGPTRRGRRSASSQPTRTSTGAKLLGPLPSACPRHPAASRSAGRAAS